MYEDYVAAMYGEYGYGHTAMGYPEHIRAMPSMYDAAVQFYDDFYRPNSVILIVGGDVHPQNVFGLAQQYYGNWEPKPRPAVPVPDPPAVRYIPGTSLTVHSGHMVYTIGVVVFPALQEVPHALEREQCHG